MRSICLSASDLGIATWKADTYQHLEVIPVTLFSGHFALARIKVRRKHYWVTVSMVHDEQEPDIEDNVCPIPFHYIMSSCNNNIHV